MGWLRSVGSIKSSVSFAEYRLFYRALLHKRPLILSILLTIATPYQFISANLSLPLQLRPVDRKKPPPPGGVSYLLYVPSSRTVCKIYMFPHQEPCVRGGVLFTIVNRTLSYLLYVPSSRTNGVLFTMFPHHEPCVRGPPSKNLVQIFRGGSSYTRFLMREHSK